MLGELHKPVAYPRHHVPCSMICVMCQLDHDSCKWSGLVSDHDSWLMTHASDHDSWSRLKTHDHDSRLMQMIMTQILIKIWYVTKQTGHALVSTNPKCWSSLCVLCWLAESTNIAIALESTVTHDRGFISQIGILEVAGMVIKIRLQMLLDALSDWRQ